MEFLASIFLKVFTSSTLNFASGVIKQISDTHAAIVRANTGLSTEQSSDVLATERTRISGAVGAMLAMMNHPIWWVGWALFALPPGLYSAEIHAKSLLCPFFSSVCEWDIKRVPPTIESWDMYVVLGFFGIFAVSSVVTLIASKIGGQQK